MKIQSSMIEDDIGMDNEYYSILDIRYSIRSRRDSRGYRSSNFYRNARFGHVREVMNSAEFCEATRVKNTETEKKRKVTYVRIPIILNVCFSIRMV